MAIRYGKCINFGLCNTADSKAILEVAEGADYKCKECSSTLTNVGSTKKVLNKAQMIAIICVIIVIVLGYGLYSKLKIGTSILASTSSTNEINLSLDQWVGWRSILKANGGLITKPGSIFDKLGIKVNIKNIDDNDAKANAFISKGLDAMGSTINRYAFEYPKIKKAGVAAKMIVITNTSNGGDGIIAKKSIKSIEGLVNKKVALARFTEAQCLLEYLIRNSSLNNEQQNNIRKNIIFTDDAGKAGEAFFAGKADAAATWQPFLMQSEKSTDSHILVDTRTFNNFILDGIIFREDFIAKNRETVEKFVEGVILATDELNKIDFKDSDEKLSYLVNSFPMFATLKKSEIEQMYSDAKLSDFTDNFNYFKEKGGLNTEVFIVSSNIWTSLGETADPKFATEAFDGSIFNKLKSKFKYLGDRTINISVEAREKGEKNPPITTQHLSINFKTGSADILETSYKDLTEISNSAKMAENSIVQIEGNTDNVGDAKFNQELSEKRARSVGTYLQYQGINPTRFIIIGNGMRMPIKDNKKEEGRAMNRRTDIMIKAVDVK